MASCVVPRAATTATPHRHLRFTPRLWLYIALLACWHLPAQRHAQVFGFRVARNNNNGPAGPTSALASVAGKEYLRGSGPTGGAVVTEVALGGGARDDDDGRDPEAISRNEPTCDQLKAMWRFSKRQSRAAETTNEIPTYRDPFRYNVWEPYGDRQRNIGSKYRRPVFGRVIHNAPMMRAQDMAERNRAFEEVVRMYGPRDGSGSMLAPVQPPINAQPARRVSAYRSDHVYQGVPPQQGSFQHLKELIRTERAKELQEQRIAEEVAARAAAIKQAADHHRHGSARYSYDPVGIAGATMMGDDGGEGAPVFVQAPQALVAYPDMLTSSVPRSRGGGPGPGHGPDGYVEYIRPRHEHDYTVAYPQAVGPLYHRHQANFFEPSSYTDFEGIMV